MNKFSMSRYNKFTSFFLALVGIFAFFTSANAAGGSWQIVGSEDFSSSVVTNIPIAISPSGTPYVAYEDGSNSNKASVMKYDGSSWVTVGSADFSASQAGDISLAFDASGTPYVAYVDAASSSRATVMKYDGSSWVAVGNADFSSSTAGGTTIGFSPSGTPYVAYIDASNSNAPTIAKFDGSSWIPVGTPFVSAQGGAPSLVFSATGTPYVAFSDIGTGRPTIIEFNGTSWGIVGTPIASVDLLGNVSLAISANGTLYVATSDINNSGYLQMFKFNGTSWVQVGSTGTISSTGILSMAFNPVTDVPYVAFADQSVGNKADVIKYDGSDWVTVGSAQFSSDSIGFTSLAFSQSGVPYVAYSDSSNNQAVVMAFLPTTPGQVTALSAAVRSSADIALSWFVPTDNGGATITGYKIERESPVGNGFSVLVADTVSTNTTYADGNLKSSTVYNYRVSAINAIGVGVSSATANATTYGVGGGFVPVTPTALNNDGTNNTALSFAMNSGAKTTNNPVVTLSFNANPQTVRGYAVSLDPNFAQASIVPYDVSTTIATFTLPNISGTYTVYFKYFSITGNSSSLLQQTIVYLSNSTPVIIVATNSTAPASKVSEFKRTLKLGSVGKDVKALQEFLNSHGFIISSKGVGSLGHETTIYGKLTAKAVAKFQEANAQMILISQGLKKGTGIFGAATMKVVNGID